MQALAIDHLSAVSGGQDPVPPVNPVFEVGAGVATVGVANGVAGSALTAGGGTVGILGTGGILTFAFIGGYLIGDGLEKMFGVGTAVGNVVGTAAAGGYIDPNSSNDWGMMGSY
jgi:hypothetical protein